MIMVAICDDQENDRMQIKRLIDDYTLSKKYDIKIMTFNNGEDLENHYIAHDYFFDIIFLDIYMDGMNGIETAKKLRKYDMECKIIFSTSSTDHALESFEVFPFHYLVKPITTMDFHNTFDRAIAMTHKEKQKSLLIKIGSSLQTVFFKDILFIESDAKILKVHLSTGQTYSFSAKLDDVQKQLQDNRFNRCHKSFLVNMDYIASVENYTLKLTTSALIPITQRNFVSIKKMFYDYLLDKSNINHNLKVGCDSI